MKLYKVFFTTEYEFTPFGEVSDILKGAKILGIKIKFNSGGWEGNTTVCYHVWEGVDDIEMMKKFIESRYGESLISFHQDATIEENAENMTTGNSEQ